MLLEFHLIGDEGQFTKPFVKCLKNNHRPSKHSHIKEEMPQKGSICWPHVLVEEQLMCSYFAVGHVALWNCREAR